MYKPNVIHIHGRKWFERTNGNTYHSVTVWVDGEQVFREPYTYGYGDQYRQTATDWLRKSEYLPGLEVYPSGCTESLSGYCDRQNINFVDEVDEVARKKDL